ncbi:MAG TPA: hypothetical protein VGT42_05410 [Gammaproteobacteria bacterium]|nr:hypothetical protein [Gammaproteobacteria bacterium]
MSNYAEMLEEWRRTNPAFAPLADEVAAVLDAVQALALGGHVGAASVMWAAYGPVAEAEAARIARELTGCEQADAEQAPPGPWQRELSACRAVRDAHPYDTGLWRACAAREAIIGVLWLLEISGEAESARRLWTLYVESQEAQAEETPDDPAQPPAASPQHRTPGPGWH